MYRLCMRNNLDYGAYSVLLAILIFWYGFGRNVGVAASHALKGLWP